ncbi:MAG: alpha/beta hydrolase [Flavobacteriales bacterium]
MKEGHIEFTQCRRFYSNDLTGKKQMLLALHGYGQLAQYFARKFKDLEETWGLVFPEGPHRFYLEGSSGRVGASWMTKEWRSQDIFENTSYLVQLIGEIKLKHPDVSISLLGFSQGGATAARLYQAQPALFEKLILWASVFPPDIDIVSFSKEAQLHFAIGNQDPYFSNSALELIQEEYMQLGFQSHIFDGGHDINSAQLLEILG